MRTYYLDSSVVLRFLFRESSALVFPVKGRFVSSELLRVECFRALHRIHQLNERSASQILSARVSFYQLLSRVKLAELNSVTLEYAARPFDLPIKTLDAIHLSTAILYKEDFETPIVMLTHDLQLGRAARSQNLEVIGCEEDI